jgi:2-hydroxy-3-keto-5-methylthiopentenyl-1-phosphate phosphatase
MSRHFLFISDFDQTLSFNDSGRLLSEMLGITHFDEKVAGLAGQNLVQQGAELAYLLRHDPEYRRVRREDLAEVGRRIRLKRNITLLPELLANAMDGFHFDFYVVSAAPDEIVHAALDGIVPPSHIIGTQLTYDGQSGEIASVERVAAGYGKVAAVEGLRGALGVPRERIVYVGDGTSDLHVMLHVNRGDGLTIAVSQAKHITEIARRTVISDDALSVLVPIMEEVAGYTSAEIRSLFERHGLVIQEWDRVRTDWLTIGANTNTDEMPVISVAA